MGLHRYFPDAEIVGVDHAPQPRYPFTFELGDAMTYPLNGFDFVWASPPCQGYSVMRHLPWNAGKEYPLLLEPTIDRLRAWGGPYLVENVAGAEGVMRSVATYHGWLCGTMFGKRFYRHRLFAAPFMWLQPPHETHRFTIQGGRALAGRTRNLVFIDQPRRGIASRMQSHVDNDIVLGVGHQPGAKRAREEMGVEWMNADEMIQAVPPCYSTYLAQFIPLGAHP